MKLFRHLPPIALLVTLLFLLVRCGGSLSDEQRKLIKKEMEESKIIRATDADITAMAMDIGKNLSRALDHTTPGTAAVDSLEQKFGVTIKWLEPATTNARVLEQELIDAYVNSIITDAPQENLQKIWNSPQRSDYDTLLYTKPRLTQHAEGIEELQGIWAVYLARKDVVLAIGKRKK